MFQEYTFQNLATSPRYLMRSGQLSLWELFWKMPEDILDYWNNQPTVYLVPGFSRSYKTMERLWEKIWEIMNVKYVPIIRGDWKKWTLAWLWEKVRNSVERSENGVIVLWHSAGGVIWVRELSSNADIDHVIQLSSPNRWSPLFNPLARHIPVAEEFVSWKHYAWIDLSKVALKVTAIRTSLDQMVPLNRQDLPWAAELELETDHFGPIMERLWLEKVAAVCRSTASSHGRDTHTPS